MADIKRPRETRVIRPEIWIPYMGATVSAKNQAMKPDIKVVLTT